MNLLQRATTGRIWPQQDCWTAFVNEARAVRPMNCGVRVIRMKRDQHAQSRSCAKFFLGCNLDFAFVLRRPAVNPGAVLSIVARWSAGGSRPEPRLEAMEPMG